HALHEVEQVVTGERVPPARDGLDVRRDRLEQTTGLPGVGVVRGAGVGARDERLLDVAGDLLELLVDLPRQLVRRQGDRTDGDGLAACTTLPVRGQRRVRDLHRLLVDLENVRLGAADPRSGGRGV